MKNLVKKLLYIVAFNLLVFATFAALPSNFSMLTGQMGINTAIATQIVGMLNAGMTVWGIIAVLGTFNVVGAGVLFTAKSMLKKMGTKAVVGW
ncbi:uberolysin/carnocyclin family circular bacteriocin [Ligilactobacillus apodemi]|uniref:uberolysin/carnocyclin family circular bacteriocin n=1 Tax=Ligilactobacillus apodemi TaxID=307126 RepID=UPI00214BA1BA|nr:uberolysin/carnocyclin family circular bacteriocin [Ligilactobacillus apodemi]MCR1900722.1 uberolysin/carnocyclin family circular bacteriocin [Ligilactobacillus apodemi]